MHRTSRRRHERRLYGVNLPPSAAELSEAEEIVVPVEKPLPGVAFMQVVETPSGPIAPGLFEAVEQPEVEYTGPENG